MTIAEQIQAKIADATRSAQRAESEARDAANAWRIIAEHADVLPLAPDRVFVGSRLYGSRIAVKFVLNDASAAKDWRETTAQLMRVFKPMATRYRYQDSCLSHPPELGEKEQARADENRANVTEIAPFVVRMERLYSHDGTLYGTTAAIDWYAEIGAHRLHIEVKIADNMRYAAEGVGFVQAPQWSGNKSNAVPTGYTPRWPFRPYRVDRFSSGNGAASNAPNLVAYWCASMCWRDDDAAEKFLALTTPHP